jgi:hypothetical protein
MTMSRISICAGSGQAQSWDHHVSAEEDGKDPFTGPRPVIGPRSAIGGVCARPGCGGRRGVEGDR